MTQFTITGYSKWQGGGLRFVVRQIPYGDPSHNIARTVHVLQQQWTRHAHDMNGVVRDSEFEWRDVPIEIE